MRLLHICSLSEASLAQIDGLKAIITCNDHTLVVMELLGEEARHDQLWIHQEKNLLLDEAGAENTSTQ